MKYTCEMIQDLLPLYLDDVASSSSRQAVEEHLEECEDCRKIFRRLKDHEAENAILEEKETVLASQRRFFEHRSAVIGSVIAGIFMIPILICLLVNLLTGAGFGRFLIVLSSLLTASSLTIVPLMLPVNRALWSAGSFTLSLLFLLAVTCIFTGGRWFFIAAFAVLFGLALLLLPFLLRKEPLSEKIANRGVFALALDTFLYGCLMISIGLSVRRPGFFRTAAEISIPLILLVWILFRILRKSGRVTTKQEDLTRLQDGLSDLGSEPESKAVHPGIRSVRKREEPGQPGGISIALLILGAPLALSLLISAIALLFSALALAWAGIVSLWALEVSFIVGWIMSLMTAFSSFIQGRGLEGIVMLSSSLVLAALSIFLYYGSMAAGKGALRMTRKSGLWVKSLLKRRDIG